MAVEVAKIEIKNVSDASGLEACITGGQMAADEVVAVIGKTEGNGGVNDFTRGYFTQSLFYMLAEYSEFSAEALKTRIPCVLSGGTEGVMSPHYVIFSVEDSFVLENSDTESLALGSAMSEPIAPEDIGRMPHIAICQKTVEEAMVDAGLSPNDVCFVQVKRTVAMTMERNGVIA